jgi:maleylacetate reductase
MRAFVCPGDIYNATPPRVVFGANTLDSVGDEVARLGARRVIVVTTPGRTALGERVARLVGERCAGMLPDAVSQVPIELARKAREEVRNRDADCIVSIGGGAAIGLAKSISLELALPIIAIPTTYSGSEVTGFCGITIDGVKRMHTSLDMLAATVIYDPVLSLRLPLDISAASALNALAHCVDAVYVPTVAPAVRLAAAEGARVIADAVVRVAARPDDLDARADLLYGAYLGGVALTGGFALQHGLAHVLGGTFGVPHGLSHALVLPYVAAYNSRYAPEALSGVAAAMNTGNLGGVIHDLACKIGVTMGLREAGLSASQLDQAAQITVDTDDGVNPAPVTLAAVRQILEDANEGRRPH